MALLQAPLSLLAPQPPIKALNRFSAGRDVGIAPTTAAGRDVGIAPTTAAGRDVGIAPTTAAGRDVGIAPTTAGDPMTTCLHAFAIIAPMCTLIRSLIITLLLMGNVACATGKDYVELKGQRFEVEIAATPEKQALGLMFRQKMADDHGMLFIFPDEAPRSFWMKNTRIPLDIMYFSAELKLVSMSENTPPCRVESCPAYPSTGPARYVLELNAGKASELGLEEGDVLLLDLH